MQPNLRLTTSQVKSTGTAAIKFLRVNSILTVTTSCSNGFFAREKLGGSFTTDVGVCLKFESTLLQTSLLSFSKWHAQSPFKIGLPLITVVHHIKLGSIWFLESVRSIYYNIVVTYLVPDILAHRARPSEIQSYSTSVSVVPLAFFMFTACTRRSTDRRRPRPRKKEKASR